MNQTLYIESSKSLSVEQGCLTTESHDGEVLVLHPHDISAIVVENTHCQVTLSALLLCIENNIPVLICNERHHPKVYCLDLYSHHELLTVISKQVSWTESRKKMLWKWIIQGKVYHQCQLLKMFGKAPENIRQIETYLTSLETRDIVSLDLNTIESITARLYFSGLFGQNFKRFEDDFINAALNYGYAIVRAVIMVEIVKKGLHPALGIWHSSCKNRFNLADDVIEILRPIVDRVVVQLAVKSELDKESKITLLELVTTPVYWNSNEYFLKQAISLFVDEIYRFMNGETDTLTLIKMVDE